MEYPIPVVRVILQNEEEEILFLKRANTNYSSDKWVLPGGKIDLGETSEKACIKEAKEETNLDIKNLKFLSYADNLAVEGESKHCLVLYFKADFSGDIKINDESSEFAWVSKEDLDNFDIAFNQKGHIRKFL